MKKFDFKKILPHVVAVVLFLIASLIFTKPVLEGKELAQHDIQQWKAMAQQSFEYKKTHEHFPRWTNSMFCGMPGYQIAMDQKSYWPVTPLYFSSAVTLGLPAPTYFLFLCCLGFYLLCIVLGVNPWLSIMGGFAYGFCTFDPIILTAGHNTEILSIAYAPTVLAGIALIFKKKYWLGGGLFTLFLTCMITQNHQQILYYTIIMSLIMALFFSIKTIKEKNFKHLLYSGGLCIVGAALALMTNAFGLFPVNEYSKESIRGGSQLTDKDGKGADNKTKGGLDKDYAFAWSYGKTELLTLMVPNAVGGGGATQFKDDPKFIEVLQQDQTLPNDAKQQIAQSSSPYWGAQSQGTSGPVYLGAIICLLALMGFIVSKNEHRWWLLAVTIFGVILAVGKNLEGINYFLFDHLPLYKKFRVPTVALVIPQLSVALMATLFANDFLFKTPKEELKKVFKNCLYVTGGVLAVLIGFYFMADYMSDETLELKKYIINQMQGERTFATQYLAALAKDRQAVYLSDMMRSIGFIIAGFAILFLYSRNIIKPIVASILLLVFSSIDLLSVDTRYLHEDNFVDPSDYESVYTDSHADVQLSKDTSYYRVLNLAFKSGNGYAFDIGNSFNDALASYKHNTIGGYHPAKLGLYNDLKDHKIIPQIQNWLQNQMAKDSFRVLNMLNMKYVIVPDQKNQAQNVVIQNPFAYGPCWLVKDIKMVSTADEEMNLLDSIDPATTAIVNNEFKNDITAQPQYDSTAYIKLVKNDNDEILYDFNAATPQFAVFSEMYYKAGWKAFIDGKEQAICKTDYALRALAIPAGKHKIEFKFAPAIMDSCEKIANIGGLLAVLFILFCFFMEWKTSKKNQTATV